MVDEGLETVGGGAFAGGAFARADVEVGAGAFVPLGDLGRARVVGCFAFPASAALAMGGGVAAGSFETAVMGGGVLVAGAVAVGGGVSVTAAGGPAAVATSVAGASGVGP